MLAKFKDFVLRRMKSILISSGYYVAKPHFYNPIPDKKYLRSYDGYWKRHYPCHGIEFHDLEQLSLIENIAKFAAEIEDLPEDVLSPKKNYSFLDMDLEFLYCMVRFLKPKRFIEVGAGWSSLVAMHALDNNRKEGYECRHALIEPYLRKYFVENESLKRSDEFINKPIQEVSLKIFDNMSRNDILFIDSSHVAKYGSDVNYLYFHIVPLLPSGCYVHIHDIFLPNDYHQKWIFEDTYIFSEQYLVMAFLMYNQEFPIRLAAQYLSQKYRNKLNSLFPRFQPYFSPGSLWLQRK